MALLPRLDYEYAERVVTDVFAGYRHRARIGDGEFYDTRNLTSAYYPLLGSRKKRGRVRTMHAPGGVLAKEKLAFVEDGALWYGGEKTAVTGLAPGKKQLVSMGAVIVIFPDKVYYNTADPSDHGSLEAGYSSVGAVEYALCRADGTLYPQPVKSETAPGEPTDGLYWIDASKSAHVLRQWSAAMSEWTEIPTVYTRLRFISEGELGGLFRKNDGVSITGAAVEAVNGEHVICAIGGGSGERDWLAVTGLLDGALTQTTGTVRIERRTPEMDFVIECKNRLWGCRYGMTEGKNLNEIYCCALGDFKNWRQYMGLSTDSWTASVGSDGPWTGAVNFQGYPMFFKENRIHRVTVSASGAHQITETVCRGVQEGCDRSLQVVNETLLYKSRADICAYQGSFPESISDALGDVRYYDAAAGVLGERYYISMRDAQERWSLFVYDIRRNLWMREDEVRALGFASLGDELYCLTPDALFAMEGTVGTPEPYVSWEAETGMLYYQYPDRKYLSRFNLRLYMEEGAQLDVYLMYDSNGEWVRQGRVKMKGTRTVTLPVRPRRCDHLRMKLVGKGEVRLYSIAKILTTWSDVG
jgi:hypothetical protein